MYIYNYIYFLNLATEVRMILIPLILSVTNWIPSGVIRRFSVPCPVVWEV